MKKYLCLESDDQYITVSSGDTVKITVGSNLDTGPLLCGSIRLEKEQVEQLAGFLLDLLQEMS